MHISFYESVTVVRFTAYDNRLYFENYSYCSENKYPRYLTNYIYWWFTKLVFHTDVIKFSKISTTRKTQQEFWKNKSFSKLYLEMYFSNFDNYNLILYCNSLRWDSFWFFLLVRTQFDLLIYKIKVYYYFFFLESIISYFKLLRFRSYILYIKVNIKYEETLCSNFNRIVSFVIEVKR